MLSRALALAAALWLGACSATQTSATALRESVEEYTRSMRWGHLERAAVHVEAAKRQAWLQKHRAAQAGVQIHEYDIRTVEHIIGTDVARIVVLAVWSHPSNPVVRQELMSQDWRRQSGIWLLVDQQPVQQPDGTSMPVQPSEAL